MKTQEEAMAEDELNSKIVFYCAECNKKHFATEENTSGVSQDPGYVRISLSGSHGI